jgi:hypothetical protein
MHAFAVSAWWCGVVWAVLHGKQVGTVYAEKVLCRDCWAGTLVAGWQRDKECRQGWWLVTVRMAVLVSKKVGAWSTTMLLA